MVGPSLGVGGVVMAMSEITLVGCTKSKRPGATRAAALYELSTLFTKRKRVAKQSDYWAILSAEYGFVEPDAVIQTYNTHISDVDSEQWADTVLADLRLVIKQRDIDTVRIFAGKKYVDPILPDLEQMGCEVLDPLRGKLIGERMSWLANA